jgi:hypothetical protein
MVVAALYQYPLGQGGPMRARYVVVCLWVGCGSSSNTSEDLGTADLSAQADLATPDLKPLGCVPGDVSTFAPTWRPPTAAHQNTCTPTQIADAVTALTSGGFSTFAAQNAACAACVVTDSEAAMLGPIVQFKTLGFFDGNRDGCVAVLTNDATASSCGAKVQAQGQCGLAACGANCPVKSNADFVKLNTCINAAHAGACITYAQAAQCTGTAMTDASTGLTSCFLANQGVATWFTDLVTLFCGS